MNIFVDVMVILVLTAVNAFFSMSEMAIISINRNKLKVLSDQGSKPARQLERIIEEPTNFLSTIQVGITLAGFLSSAFAATGISGKLLLYFDNPPSFLPTVLVVVVTLVLSYFTLVFGELVPKRLALQNSEKIALRIVGIVRVMESIAKPFVRFLAFSTNLVLRIFGVSNQNMEEKVSREEIKSLVEVGQEHGIINETEVEMINSIIEFDNKIAEEVMTPRRDVYMIDIQRPLVDYLDEMLEEQYSRIPVYEGNQDHIIGILHMKDFVVQARRVGFEQVDIRSILQPAYFVPERKNIDDLFRELQAINRHLAILIDEHGGFSGIVSIEDLIEEVMGDIEDEFDEEVVDYEKIDDTTYIVSGAMIIEDINDLFDLHFDEASDDYDTIGGLMLKELGYIPTEERKAQIIVHGVRFETFEVADKRIKRVKITLPHNPKSSKQTATYEE
ncbi:MAG: hemolysin family protein [Erysipelotrichaceae bacterium]